MGGLPGTILHGTCTLAWAVRDVVRREADANPGRVRRISCRFTGMVLPGTDITMRALGKRDEGETEQVFFEVLDAKGRRALSEGFVELRPR